jgi:hypothetical protein
MSISVASSQKKPLPSSPKVVAVLKKYATEIAMAIRVIIPGFFSFNSSLNPFKNGHPP